MQLNEKAALVTGAGRGIGRAIALALAESGADLGVLARTQSEVEEVAETARAWGRNAIAVACDVEDGEAVKAAVDAICQVLGRLDVLVNNAGGARERAKIGEDDPEAWAAVVQTNLVGTYFVSRACLPYLRRDDGGTIINVGSGMGHEAHSGNSSYHAAKAGLWMLTRCLALEAWEDQVTVNELVPGPVYTQLTEHLFRPGEPHPAIPSEFVKDPADVVPLALFLAGQPTHGPTGQSFSLARRPID